MTIHHGDCLEVMATLDAESIDAIVTDPPYGLGFMGKHWDHAAGAAAPLDDVSPMRRRPEHDAVNAGMSRQGGRQWRGTDGQRRQARDAREYQAWCETWAAGMLRVAKPSAYLLAFGGTRTVHRMTCAIEDAGWIIRDMLVWGYACLSDDTEVLTSEGWVRYNSASDGQLAAAFDPATGDLRWSPILAVHRYDHDGAMAEVGPSLVTLNHRVVIDEATGRVPRVPGMRDYVRPVRGVASEGGNAGLLAGVQRQAAHPRSAVPSGAGVVAGATATAVRSDDRPGEPRLEWRSYRVQEAWDVLGSALRASAGVGTPDGPFGRLPDGASLAYRRGVRLPAHPDGVRQPREPRPDGQPAREPDALAGQPDAQALRMGQVPAGNGEPDAVRLVDGYQGVVWCITVGTGAFVARRNGIVFVTGNSGFPKSKASLKPAWEPIVMARKPGPLRALNIDGCRIGTGADVPLFENLGRDGHGIYGDGLQGSRRVRPGEASADRRYTANGGTDLAALPGPRGGDAKGRWPANVILTDPIFDGGIEGVVGGGESASGISVRRNGPGDGDTSTYGFAMPPGTADAGYTDSGTYSRFFLIPKAARSDREPVLGGLPERLTVQTVALGDMEYATYPDGSRREARPKARANVHPTVKPVDLMRHLVRLVTPPGGTVLDPFLGSGTTALAAEMEGFEWIGIEREAEYVAIAEARLNGTQKGMAL